jgi:hypothetical protein
MSKGWTIEVTIWNPAHWGDHSICVQSFDVAIEDQNNAEDAVRQSAGASAVVQKSLERANFSGLSPGRIRSRPSVLLPRSRL